VAADLVILRLAPAAETTANGVSVSSSDRASGATDAMRVDADLHYMFQYPRRIEPLVQPILKVYSNLP